MTALATNTSVISLNLSGNYINYGIIEAIARLLDKDSSLKYLNFSQSVVSDDHGRGYLRPQGGCITILQALARNTSLKYLNFAVNDLSAPATLKALLEALNLIIP